VALWVVAVLEPTDVGVLGHGPAHPLGAPPYLPFRTAPMCIPVNTLGGEGTHGLQPLKATVVHGGAKLGHNVDELQEPLKVTLFSGEEAGAAGGGPHGTFLNHAHGPRWCCRPCFRWDDYASKRPH